MLGHCANIFAKKLFYTDFMVTVKSFFPKLHSKGITILLIKFVRELLLWIIATILMKLCFFPEFLSQRIIDLFLGGQSKPLAMHIVIVGRFKSSL